MSAEREQLGERGAVAAMGGQSAYADPGRLSPAQRAVWTERMLDLLTTTARAAGYAAGYEDGHRAGRRAVWREVGPEPLVASIERDLAAVRRGLDNAPDPFYPMGESW